jgi:acyl-CoA synthetase (AMP-forming)/AMP-acid ligase II
MSPFYWVRSPAVLFWTIDKLHATHCYMPNFAYSHCTLNIRERDLTGLDLSHMRMFMNGGEPIYDETLTGFLKRFAPYGIQPEMISAGYGLAEVSGAVSVTPTGQFPRIDWVDTELISRSQIAQTISPDSEHKMSIVSCGKLSPGAQVRIVDGAENDLPERRVGEVLIGGSFTFKGYLQQMDTNDAPHNDGWLRTGDLGYLADGELYICGRKKDMMIIGGQNLFPEYLEQAVLEIPEIRPGRTVVFGMEDPKLRTEMAVMVCELKEALPEDEQRRVIREVRRRVVLATDIALGDVRLVERGWIHKTSSGKMSRNLNREKYINEFKER